MRRKAHLPRHLLKGGSRGRAPLRITSSYALGFGLMVTTLSLQYGQDVLGQHLNNLTSPVALINDRSWHANAPGAQEPFNKPTPPIEKQAPDDSEQMQKTITRLRTENEALRKKVAQFEQIRKFNSVQERMTKEELRAENLQTQLVGVAEKEASLQASLTVNDLVIQRLRAQLQTSLQP